MGRRVFKSASAESAFSKLTSRRGSKPAAVLILARAAELVAGDRQHQHGDPARTHRAIADLWSGWLGIPITTPDAAVMMVLLKLARTNNGRSNDDDYIDACGYAALAADIRETTDA